MNVDNLKATLKAGLVNKRCRWVCSTQKGGNEKIDFIKF